ncbi:MAG: DUF29 domain-containing protein [Geminicoccaceae bacterium]|nr:DUF29 domain-containing protein [Geminicoccaceae bacterium]
MVATRTSPARSVVRRDEDFRAWALEQARLLRERRLDALDHELIAGEFEASGAEQEHALESSLRVLLVHLLKWRYQPSRRSRSWRAAIVRERLAIPRRLGRNPSLRRRLPELFREAYRDARKEAAAQTGSDLGRFPEEPPFTLEEALDEEFWPEAE